MKTFVTADLHLGHHSIIDFCNRPFLNTEDMDSYIIDTWNEDVSPKDTVYILGDVSFHKIEKTIELVSNLNGKKILIAGNHDTKIIRQDYGIFAEIVEYKTIKYAGNYIVMFHYPIDKWDRKHYGSIHLHGHCHGTLTRNNGRSMDVGMDTNSMRVYNLDYVVNSLSKILI